MPLILRLNQTGDTIVEVLLAIAIVSAVLGASFTAINQSTQVNRQAQERSYALELAESQLELLASISNKEGINGRCISDSLAVTTACGRGPDNRYSLSIIDHRAQPGGANTYSSVVEWEKIGGSTEQERVEIYYRVEN